MTARLELALHGFYHHNGIIDHGAYHQHQCKQRDEVQRKAYHIHERECTYQRHHNGQRRNQRGPDILQEQQHDKHHQYDGLEERGIDFLHRDIQEVVGVEQ